MSEVPLATMVARPSLSAGVRLRPDPVRGGHVALGPERVLMLDPLAAAILLRCDGTRAVGGIAATLACEHAAGYDEVLRDVANLVARLAADGWLAAGGEVADGTAALGPAPAAPPAPDGLDASSSASEIPAPVGLLAELTHRCPLRCPYCSNPLELVRAKAELDTAAWSRVFDEASALGVLQLHLSGGEPLLRSDVAELAAAARSAGLYVNLVTSGVGLDARRAERLAAAGVEHVQLSLQDVHAGRADEMAGMRGAHEEKLAAARAVRAAGVPLTVNWVVHRGNADAAAAVLDLARELGASRVEVAHAQLHGWGLLNQGALVPTWEQAELVASAVEAARRRWAGVMRVDAVISEVWARRPKACMQGWGRRFLVVDPRGDVLPCHAARTVPGLAFDSVRDCSLASIWTSSPSFTRFRGTAWMHEPCRSCERREIDWGGCRCQALAFAGDARAVDPACDRSPEHAAFREVGLRAGGRPRRYVHRGRSVAPASGDVS